MRGVRRPRRRVVEADVRHDRKRDNDDERRDYDGDGDGEDRCGEEGDRRDQDRVVGIIFIGLLRDDDEQRQRTGDDHDLDVVGTGDDVRRLLRSHLKRQPSGPRLVAVALTGLCAPVLGQILAVITPGGRLPMNLVVGATGNVGGSVARALRDQGKPVRAMVRETSDPERVRSLEELGAEVVRGELRDPDSLARACAGVTTVVSGATAITALGTDSITAVDRDGQLALVDAATSAGVDHFIYVSYTRHVDTDDPLTQAKRAVEKRLRGSGMAFTILRPSFFMEMWLGPPLGWELEAGSARVLGTGEQRVSFISAQDVVAAVVACVDNPAARGQTIELGGAAVSPLEVVRLAESISGRPIVVEHVPAEALEHQARDAAGTDASIFPSLMLCQTRGDEIGPCPDWLQPATSVEDYLRGLLARA